MDRKCIRSNFSTGSAAKVSGFERWYPEKGMTTEEYEKPADGWLQLLQEITRN
jgi:hypothetical protein